MPAPNGFTYVSRSNGEVVISHHGKVATVLRGHRARKFLAAVEDGDAAVEDGDSQALMARITGNYKRGNERR